MRPEGKDSRPPHIRIKTKEGGEGRTVEKGERRSLLQIGGKNLNPTPERGEMVVDGVYLMEKANVRGGAIERFTSGVQHPSGGRLV